MQEVTVNNFCHVHCLAPAHFTEVLARVKKRNRKLNYENIETYSSIQKW